MDPPATPLLLNALADDGTSSHEEAILRIYQRLRPGNPPQLEKARALFHEKFYDTNRYRLGRVGRFRINRKLGLTVPEDEMVLRPEDLISAVRYILKLVAGDSDVYVDDIDHLGNRRLRTIDELACDELRKGFLKLRRTVQERMSLKDIEDMTPRSLINPKSISAAIEYFFGRGELSQVVDQTNPLSMLTHERRLSALGPGGLNRKRAGFEVRDVHISHYGRICPIETPEGTNIGLISSLAMYASVDEYGFLVTPYRKISKGKLTDEVVWLRADEESEAFVASADSALVDGKLQGETGDTIVARHRSDFVLVPVEQIQYMDVTPSQMIGVSAGLIPFLEHDDANRALMGSNMQRQAVPLLITEPPIVGTGLETDVALHSGMILRAGHKGTITYVDAERIEIGPEVHRLRKFVGLNERTCQNHRPIVKPGDKVEKGQVIADGAATYLGELALGRNVLAAFMSWEGYNFEDAIIISEELVKNDTYTSIHIEEFDVEIRETKLGREEFTRDIPNVSEKMLRNLDENGIVQIGTYVEPGDILVGKVSPKSKTELTPEEKLLHAIFGRAGEDVKNDSLEVPSGVEGIVIDTQRFSRRMSLTEDQRKEFERSLKVAEKEGNEQIAQVFGEMITELEEILGRKITDDDGNSLVHGQDPAFVAERAAAFKIDGIDIRSPQKRKDVERVFKQLWPNVEEAIDARDRRLNSMKRGDELRSGVLQMVKVYIATKRVISVGDKMAGRHGNKGVISKILPVEDMPYLEDGTPVQIMLNPLGVPSRMNVGQILETHLGWAGAKLGFRDYAGVRRRFRGRHQRRSGRSQPAQAWQDAAVRRPHGRGVRTGNDRGLHLHAEAAPPGGRQGARPQHGSLLVDHAAAAGRQGAVRGAAVRRDGSVGAGGVRRRVHFAGVAHGEERRRRRADQDLRIDGQRRKHAGSGHAGELRRIDERDPRAGAEYAVGEAADLKQGQNANCKIRTVWTRRRSAARASGDASDSLVGVLRSSPAAKNVSRKKRLQNANCKLQIAKFGRRERGRESRCERAANGNARGDVRSLS